MNDAASDMKACTGCYRTVPILRFSVRRASRDGRCYRCKDCDAERYLAHRPIDRPVGRGAKPRLTPEERAQHRRETARRSYLKHSAKRAETRRQWRARNPGKASLYARRWAARNPEKSRAIARASDRRARGWVDAGSALEPSDRYIKNLLYARIGKWQAPQELVELKRAHLKVKRLIKELSQ